jgi:uncharacterized protein
MSCVKISIWYKITKQRLNQIEKAEEFLHYLDIRQVRVRYYKETAKIEVLKKDFQKIIKNSDYDKAGVIHLKKIKW